MHKKTKNTALCLCLLLTCCSEPKNDPPSISIDPLYKFTDEIANVQARIATEGDAPVTERGFCWSDWKETPTIADSKIEYSFDRSLIFTVEIVNLIPEKEYYMRAYAINKYGTVYSDKIVFKTKASWQKLNSGTTKNLTHVYFPFVDMGYAVGANGTILKTMDSGTTWVSQNSGVSTTLNCIYAGSTNGFAVGQNGVILHTINGGNTWNKFTDKVLTANFKTILMRDGSEAFVAGDNKIYRTYNNGGSWWLQYDLITVKDFISIQSANYFDYAISGIGDALESQSKDDFSPYTVVIAKGLAGKNFNAAALTKSSNNGSGSTCFMVGDEGTFASTNDWCRNWESKKIGSGNHLYGVGFNTGGSFSIVVGSGGTVLNSFDQGANWITMNSRVTQNLKSVHVSNDKVVYAVGDGGTILKYKY